MPSISSIHVIFHSDGTANGAAVLDRLRVLISQACATPLLPACPCIASALFLFCSCSHPSPHGFPSSLPQSSVCTQELSEYHNLKCAIYALYPGASPEAWINLDQLASTPSSQTPIQICEGTTVTINEM